MNLSKLIPPPIPADERIEHAAEVLAQLGELEARELEDWFVTFRRDNLECTGVWPPKQDQELSDIEVPLVEFAMDNVDPDGSISRNRERCRLAIRQGIERHDLELRLMREALESHDER